MVLVVTFVGFFALAFRLLYSNHPCVLDETACFNDLIDADDFDDTAMGLTSFSQSLLTIFNMGLFGVYSVNGFHQTISEPLTTLVFCCFMVVVTVVSLNALIAILGDSFDRAQDMKLASRNRQRAELIVEYFDVMGVVKRKQTEQSTCWIYQLVPRRGRVCEADAWQGRLFAMRDAIKRDGDGLKSELNQKIDDMNQKQQEMMKSMLESIKQDAEHLSQQAQAKLDEKLSGLSDDTRLTQLEDKIESRLSRLESRLTQLEENIERKLTSLISSATERQGC